MNKKKVVQSLLRMLPKKMSLYLGSKSIRFAQNLPPGITTEVNYCGLIVSVNSKYPLEKKIISGHYNSGLEKIFSLFIHSGDCVVDVGANFGALSFHASQLVGEGGSVYAIEPGPLTYERMVNTIERNKVKNIHPIKSGLSDHECTLQWKLDLSNLGNAFLVEDGGDIDVPVKTLDAIVEEHELKRVDFVKVDVEGMELEVFQGAARVLAEMKPVLLFETMEEKRNFPEMVNSKYYERLEDLLVNSGYYLFSTGEKGYSRVRMKDTSDDTLAIHRKDKTNLDLVGFQEN